MPDNTYGSILLLMTSVTSQFYTLVSRHRSKSWILSDFVRKAKATITSRNSLNFFHENPSKNGLRIRPLFVFNTPKSISRVMFNISKISSVERCWIWRVYLVWVPCCIMRPPCWMRLNKSEGCRVMLNGLVLDKVWSQSKRLYSTMLDDVLSVCRGLI